ncbi:hypothetical protein PQX77_013949 [Marasmius sp. AFHP31]|nr:hypothetical protein PQX77_013949 [Marasmius sp. AFHP31]
MPVPGARARYRLRTFYVKIAPDDMCDSQKDNDPSRAPRQKELPATKSGKTAPTRSAKAVPAPVIMRTRFVPPSVRLQISRAATAASVARPAPFRNVSKAIPAGFKPLVKAPVDIASKTIVSSRPTTFASAYQLYQLLFNRATLKPPQPQVQRAYHNVPSPLKERSKANLEISGFDSTKDAGDDFLVDV